MIATISRLTLLSLAVLSGCASSPFTETWKDPNATPLEFKSEKVVAVVLAKSQTSRRLAEDRLAQQIAVRGAQGRTMYSMLPDAREDNEAATRAALEAQGVKGVIVMRPISVDKELDVVNTTHYEPAYMNYWGGYYGYGWGASYGMPVTDTRIRETTVVYIETLVYSLKQNKLVWGGKSKKTNPDNLAVLVEELAEALAKELKKEKLIR